MIANKINDLSFRPHATPHGQSRLSSPFSGYDVIQRKHLSALRLNESLVAIVIMGRIDDAEGGEKIS